MDLVKLIHPKLNASGGVPLAYEEDVTKPTDNTDLTNVRVPKFQDVSSTPKAVDFDKSTMQHKLDWASDIVEMPFNSIQSKHRGSVQQPTIGGIREVDQSAEERKEGSQVSHVHQLDSPDSIRSTHQSTINSDIFSSNSGEATHLRRELDYTHGCLSNLKLNTNLNASIMSSSWSNSRLYESASSGNNSVTENIAPLLYHEDISSSVSSPRRYEDTSHSDFWLSSYEHRAAANVMPIPSGLILEKSKDSGTSTDPVQHFLGMSKPHSANQINSSRFDSFGFSNINDFHGKNNLQNTKVSQVEDAKPWGQSMPWTFGTKLPAPEMPMDTRSILSPSIFHPVLASAATLSNFNVLQNHSHQLFSNSHGQAYGSNLSPMAAEFNGQSNDSFVQPSPWNVQPRQEVQQNNINPNEPLNYRRLLERNMSCNWKYIVDKIVCNNDQQASIFLQQKLKVGTAEQRYDIVQAIIDQAFPLMVNRFGNFLVQRCFEHGTPEQIIAISRAIRGNTLNLSMDAFGCHVVQKAFDCAPEEYKAIMVHELLRRIPETVIHRYACHVWQKLFELRWSGSPPQIMKYVNEALRGMWHEVALGETGSLVVQNIFENCRDEDKRPCINEVLASIDVIAHGQFGSWCIQHICEHGSIPDRARATDHVLRFATEYSIDQFASKVVEKCLKIGDSGFLDRYLARICEARPDRPRMPLIDIAGDQFGNYLVQYIVTHADPNNRELVAGHIRKHMVSLRGSKYGSRVAMLCSNPTFANRPGTSQAPALDRAPGGATRSGYGGDRGSWSMQRSSSFDRGF